MSRLSEIVWSAQHCGIHRGTIQDVIKYMPEVGAGIAEDFPRNPYHYIFDIKVHMLMPGQYPCIPNWHFDLVPRDDAGNLLLDRRTRATMFLWLSGPPLTQFRATTAIPAVTPEIMVKHTVEPQTWVSFTQFDSHRGCPSDQHCWRGFIRAAPKSMVGPNEKPLRRHCQVYLDADNFTW